VLQKRSAHDERQRELLDRAMKALNPRDSATAREHTMRTVNSYKKLIGLSRGAKTFSSLRSELRQQSARARKLAEDVEQTLPSTEFALYLLHTTDAINSEIGVNQDAVDDSFWGRVELIKNLKTFADHTEKLTELSTWPLGGRRNVVTGLFRSLHKWLAHQCLKTFFSFGNRADIKVTSPQHPSPFGKYAEAVYELATGTTPDDSGLEKALNETVRAYWKKQA
jgi:hypothetical protein